MPDAEPKLALYGQLGNPFTEKCRRALAFKGLRFELHEPSGPEDVRRWSPETGLLPVLTIDDELVSDSTNILYRLERVRPEPALLSADPIVAAQQRSLEDWADESFLWYWQEWNRLADAEEAPRRESVWRRLRRRLGLGGGAASARERALAETLRGIEARFDDLVNLLGSRRFFHADEPSLADLTVYAMFFALRQDEIPGTAALLEARPSLLAFMRRVEAATGS